MTDRVVGVAVIVKSGMLTARVTPVVCDSVPLLPVIVSGEVPVGVEASVLIVSVEVPEPPVTVAGLNVPVAPAGRPDTDRETSPVKPFCGDTVTV